MDNIEQMLKELTEASGVSGYEEEARGLMRKYLAPLGELSQDKLGSLICRKQGSAAVPRIMLAGHVDEIGFMVKLITKEGFIHFTPLGGWPNQHLPSQRVIIQTVKGDIPGVICTKAPFLLPEEERKKMPDRKDMFIDIGATSLAEVEEAGVRPGDPVVPVSAFTVMANKKQTYMAKAFDDRIGCALTIAVMRDLAEKPHPNTVYGVATVQEEVGLRGATTSAEAVNPDVAFALDVSPIGDIPGSPPDQPSEKIGGGPAIILYDRCMIPNVKLRNLTVDTAKELGITLQFSAVEFGGYDTGAIHMHGIGVPGLAIGVPTRHVHSHNAILRRDDFDSAVRLLTALIQKLDSKTVAGLSPV
jgi:endoglucanase